MKKKLTLSVITVCAITLALIGNFNDAEAAAFLKFDGVDGESKDANHDKWIDVLSFSQTITREESSAGAARQRADVVFGDVVVVKELDKSSPKLAESMFMGKVFPKVEIHVASNVGTYFAYELTNVMVTSYSISGDADDRPTEEVAFNFEEIKMIYTEMDSEGKSKGKVEASWKVEEGTK